MNKYRVERGVKIKRSQLSNNDYNPNKTTEKQQQAIAESLQEYGQLTAVLVRPNPKKKDSYIIIDGEHRGMVLDKELYVDVVHGLKDADAKKLTVIMNETRGSADKIELAKLLASLESDFEELEELNFGLPYEDIELQELIDLADVDWGNYGNSDEGNSDSDNQEDGSDDEWYSVGCKIPGEVLDVFNQVRNLISEEKDLHEDRAIANGQILEILCAEYLAIPKAID